MRRSFQLWLFVSVALAFAALFYLTYYLQTKEAFGSAEAMIELRMDDAKKQIAINENNLKAVLDICNASMANDVKTVAYILSCAPAFATNAYKLEELRRVMGYDEVHIINRHALIENSAIDPVLGNAENYIGFNLKLHAQSEPFVHGIGKQDFVLVQPPLPRGMDRKLFQYGGASRLDDEGIVQLGISAVTVLPYVLVRNGGIPIGGAGALSYVLLAVLVVVQTGLAYIFYFGSMGVLPVQEIALLGYLEPVVSVLGSALVLHEPLGIAGAIGAAMVIAAAALGETVQE